MQRFERWQPVEVRPWWDDETWQEARYHAPYDDKVSDLSHDVATYCPATDSIAAIEVSDSDIRPLPRFEATGDELIFLAGLLAEVEQRMVNTDMSNAGTIGPETAAVNAMLRRCWAAMGGKR